MSRAHLWQLGAAELAALVRSGKVSSREAVEPCLSRMEEVYPRGAFESEQQLFSGRTIRRGHRRGRPLPRGSSWTT